jgi:hypothetical protein
MKLLVDASTFLWFLTADEQLSYSRRDRHSIAGE